MTYFFERLFVFVTITCFFNVIGPSFMQSKFAPSDWLFSLVFTALVFSGLFTVIFGASELFRKAVLSKISMESRMIRDAIIAVFFLFFCLIFLFAPRPNSFSFGDNVGLIFENGYLTIHGFYIQIQAFGSNIAFAILFWIACRLDAVIARPNRNHTES